MLKPYYLVVYTCIIVKFNNLKKLIQLNIFNSAIAKKVKANTKSKYIFPKDHA